MEHSPVTPVPVPRASDCSLRVHTEEPENLETRAACFKGWMVPTSAFYRRNHFPYPPSAGLGWRLIVDGEVERPQSLTLRDLKSMDQTSLWALLECAGNKRAFFSPPPTGDAWGIGAVGQAEWSGVPLRTVLAQAGLRPEAAHVIFTGSDHGLFEETGEHVPFARSLPLQKALAAETILALTMNGDPLPHVHGGAVRLVVPGWYGVASVKWLQQITVSRTPNTGPFQTRDYVYLPALGAYDAAVPFTETKVQSIILSPSPGARLPAGRHTVQGRAWAGESPLVRVDISLDEGATWLPAELLPPTQERYAWHIWQASVDVPTGTRSILSRATDATGESQPMQAPWNAKGYGNNSVARVDVTVGRSPRGSWLLEVAKATDGSTDSYA